MSRAVAVVPQPDIVCILPTRCTTEFIYADLPAVASSALRAHAVRIRKLNKIYTIAAIEAGLELISVKHMVLDHGQFGAWVEAECGFSLSTAENYMAAARFSEGKIPTVAILPLATVYRISAKGANPEVVAHVLDRAAKGDVVSDKVVKDALKEVRHQKREAQREREKADRRRRMPRKKREEEEAAEQRWLAQLQKWDEERQETVSILIEKFGEADARFIAETLGRSSDSWDVIVRLHKRLGIVLEVAG